MFIAILGRQPAIGIAECERVFDDVSWFSDTSAVIHADSVDIQRLGGVIKAGRVVAELQRGDWRQASMKLVQAYRQAWSGREGKITLGISAYGFNLSGREVQKTGIILKSKLKESGVSLRLIPNDDTALGSATSHHNKLGLADNKVELLVVRGHGGKIIIAESVGTQNITALARRDQGRPARDAFVGMLPPKLALTMLNLAGTKPRMQVLDPFCGTGVVLQEGLLLDYTVSGSDLNPKMVDYTMRNIDWIKKTHDKGSVGLIRQGDAMDFEWVEAPNLDAVVCEAYLGQPFSAPPSPPKLVEVRGNCDHIISSFLKNIARQIHSGAHLCVAVPAWRAADGSFTHLPLINKLDQLGYRQHTFKNISSSDLLYYREDQVVARELLVLEKLKNERGPDR
jgi:tRNA G10  N-methylase Trm11